MPRLAASQARCVLRMLTARLFCSGCSTRDTVQVLSAMRTVFAYGGEIHEAGRYGTHVLAAAKFGIRKGAFIGMCVGVMVASFYLVYGVSLFGKRALQIPCPSVVHPLSSCLYGPKCSWRALHR